MFLINANEEWGGVIQATFVTMKDLLNERCHDLIDGTKIKNKIIGLETHSCRI
jgi:hypothetical protein